MSLSVPGLLPAGLFAAGLLLAAGSCAVPPRDARATSVPPGRTEGAARVPAEREGREEVFPIDLDTALRLAGEKDLAVAIARLDAAAATDEGRAASLRWLPSLRPRAGFFRHEGRIQETAGDIFDVQKQNVFAGGGIELVLDPRDAIFQALAARQRARAAALDLSRTEEDVGLAVALAYQDLIGAHAARAIAEESLDHAREILAFREARREGGAALPAAVLRARALVAEAEGTLATETSRTRVASLRLAQRLRLADGTVLVPAAETIEELSFFPAEVSQEELIRRALSQRPEIERGRRSLDALRQEQLAARYGWAIPRLRAGASYGGFGSDLGNLSDQEIYSAGLEWDLSAALLPLSSAAEARLRAGGLEQTALRDRILREILEAREGIRAARERLRAARSGIEAAEEAFRLSQARLREGTGLLLEVLDAARALEDARRALAAAQLDQNRAQLRLLHAVGGMREAGAA